MKRLGYTPNNRFAIEIARLEKAAIEDFDGHFTLFRFTTGWQAYLGTVDAEDVRNMPAFTTIGKAVDCALGELE